MRVLRPYRCGRGGVEAKEFEVAQRRWAMVADAVAVSGWDVLVIVRAQFAAQVLDLYCGVALQHVDHLLAHALRTAVCRLAGGQRAYARRDTLVAGQALALEGVGHRR